MPLAKAAPKAEAAKRKAEAVTEAGGAAAATTAVVKAEPSKVADKGNGMDPKEVSRMLGLLKYRKEKGEGQESTDAACALTMYNNMEPDEKNNFLGMFPKKGTVKTPGSIGKVVGEYKRQIGFVKVAEAAVVEDFYTRLAVRAEASSMKASS